MTRCALQAEASQTTSRPNKCELFEAKQVTSGLNIRFRLANTNLGRTANGIMRIICYFSIFAGKIIFYRVLRIPVVSRAQNCELRMTKSCKPSLQKWQAKMKLDCQIEKQRASEIL